MLERGHLAAVVEGIALVGNSVEEDTAGAQLPEVGADRPDRILAVLEEVVGDNEVLRPVGDRLEQLAVVDQIGVGQRPAAELRVLLV